MFSRTLASQKQRLDWLFLEASRLPYDQTELQAHWARYLCVLVAGFLENALSDVYSRYAKASSNPYVSNYVEGVLNRVQNPKCAKFLETARSFNQTWEQGLVAFVGLEGRKEAIDAIMSNRHLIAHGKDSGITLVRVKEYFRKCIEVIEFIENQCGLQR